MIDLMPVFTAAYEHAKTSPTRETCGIVVAPHRKLIYVPCRNIASSDDEFSIHPEDYLACEERGIVGIVHSHLGASAQPSMADLAGCEKTGLPWFIVALENGSYHQFGPTNYKPPLIGRPFMHNVFDCFSLARDYYATQGIDVMDFDREDEWWEKGFALLTPDNFLKAGFRVVTDGSIQEGDGIIMQNGHSDIPNHVGVYLGNNMMLHHSGNSLSCRTPYGGYWIKTTNFIVRHESKC